MDALVKKALKKHDGNIFELSLELRLQYATVWRWIRQGVKPSRLAQERLQEIINNGKRKVKRK
jgi:hypothetical protein